jgi:glycine dehydrogenase subunit 1
VALAATIHLALMGREGLREVADASVRNAHYAYRMLTERGVEALYPDTPFFREFAIRLPSGSREAIRRGVDQAVLPGVSLARFPDLDVEDGLLIAFTEKHTREEIDGLVDLLSE